MQQSVRDSIFISYSHKDSEIYAEVKQKLLDRKLVDWVRDDNDIRPSDKWDPRLQQMIDAAAVAVLILSDSYFRRRGEGQNYLLEQELPYLLVHYQQGELDLLLLYWSPSPHFNLEHPADAEPFNYVWNGQQRPPYDLHQIQAVFGDGRVAKLAPQDRLDVLQKLALEAKKRLNERRAASNQSAVISAEADNRHLLSIEPRKSS